MSLERGFIKYCSPTLAGIKTGNLFNYFFNDLNLLLSDIDNLNNKFADKGISIALLKVNKNSALIYVYREKMLLKDISDALAIKILLKYGYNNLNIKQCIEKISVRLSYYEEFPHEIGLFLGYPPEDVNGFICNKGSNCNLCGYWKVYGDTKKAIAKFEQYDKCKSIYKKLWQDGKDIMLLTVRKGLVA